MSADYKVTLINLAGDARSAAATLAPIERTGLSDPELRMLFLAFGELDAVENAVAEPEIRVKVRNESHLIRTGQKRFMLYDVAHRDQPALVLTLDEVMGELDGSAQTARIAEAARHQLAAMETPVAPPPSVLPVVTASKPRLLGLTGAAIVLLVAIFYLRRESDPGAIPTNFRPSGPEEAVRLQESMAGVYLTGNEPGQHGIVINAAGELKLFELDALNAPRLVYATGKPGHVEALLAVVTDQPGGFIEVTDHDTLVYCGETYRRIP